MSGSTERAVEKAIKYGIPRIRSEKKEPGRQTIFILPP